MQTSGGVWRAFRRNATAYLYLVPLLVLYTAFVAYPALQTFWLSLFKIDGINIRAGAKYVGSDNFRRLFADATFWYSLSHNFMWTAFSMVVPVGFGLLVAVLLSGKRLRGRTTFRTLLFLPQVLSLVVVGLIWSWMFNPYYGPVNKILKSVGLDVLARPWLGDYTFALPAILVGFSWHFFGFCMVIFLAGIQGIDEALYDAAKVDGASELQQFRYVTLPGLRQAFTVVLLIAMIDSFKVFDIIRVTTNGGPGEATEVLSLLLYKKVFFGDDVGYGAAVAVINTLFIVTISTLFLLYRRRVESEW